MTYEHILIDGNWAYLRNICFEKQELFHDKAKLGDTGPGDRQ